MTYRDTPLATIDVESTQGAQVGSYVDVLYHNRKLIIAVTTCFVLIGSAYALLAEPVYQADIVIQVEENENAAKNALSDVSSMFAVKTAASAEIEVLRSRMVLSRAVDSTHLDMSVTPHYFPVFGKWLAHHLNNLRWSGLGGYAWGSETITVDTFEVPDALTGLPFTLTLGHGGAFTLTQKDITLHGRIGEPLRAETPAGPVDLVVSEATGKPGVRFDLVRNSRLATIQALQKSLLITEKGKGSDVIGVALEGTDPVKTAAILNAIGKEYVQQNVDRTEAEAQKSIDFLHKQLPELKSQLEGAENRFNAFRTEHGTVDLNAESAALLQRTVDAQTKASDFR